MRERLVQIEQARPRAADEPPCRVRLRTLALATALACVAAQVLSHIDPGAAASGFAAPGAVLGQAFWNAAQVGLLLLLLCLVYVDRRWWAAVLTSVLACLPFAIYALSPGAMALSVVLVAICLLGWVRKVPDLGLAITDAPVRQAPTLTKFEVLAFACNLLCSMYNFAASPRLWPYWASIYAWIGSALGFALDRAKMLRGLYTLGIDGFELPSFINIGSPVSNVGALVFVAIWAVLPTLYVLYFAVLAKLAVRSPGTRVQQALCLFAIFHFLFLTDIVDYRYGRGLANPAAHWCHWAEVLAWRIAILLPIYQKVTAGDWKRGNGRLGVAVHYLVAAWAVGFFLHEVVLLDLPRFALALRGQDFTPIKLFGFRPKEFGYNGALVLMTCLYGFVVLAMRCKRIRAFAIMAPVDHGHGRHAPYIA